MSSTLPDALDAELLAAIEAAADGSGAEDPEKVLDRLCAEHPGHAATMRQRFARHRKILAALDDGPAGSGSSGDGEGDLPPTMGPYQPIRGLGQGGMGEVFLARQLEPIQRDVALKVMRGDYAVAAWRQRFAREQGYLARLAHPGIASILDAGHSPDGRPFLAMEYVPGAPITDWCRKERADLGVRLALMEQVCAAVQHAHQKGLIHRDLKPANILVRVRDGDPEPVVIDFGLARLLEEGTDPEPRTTIHGAVLGTLEYMSPEQATADETRIDVRTDVYGLGVILYELLTGALPVPVDPRRPGGLRAVQDQIQQHRPLAPSRQVLQQPQGAVAAGASSAGNTTRYSRRLRQDVDWILARALAKEPARRYPSAESLRRDLERFRQGLPVEAGPPSARYHASRFIRRHRGPVAAGAFAVLSLVAGLFTAIAFYQDAEEARADAEAQAVEADRQRRLAEARMEEADRERRRAQTIAGILQEDLFTAALPNMGGPELTVVDALRNAIPGLRKRLAGEPDLAAPIHATIANTLIRLGEYDTAWQQLELAGAAFQEVAQQGSGAPRAGELLLYHEYRAEVLLSRNEVAAARAELQQGRELLARQPDAAGRAGFDLRFGHLEVLALRAEQRHGAAMELLRELVASLDDRRDVEPALRVQLLSELATQHMIAGEARSALDMFERAAERAEAELGPTASTTLFTTQVLTVMLLQTGGAERAVAMQQRVVSGSEQVFGPEHMFTLQAADILAVALHRAGRLRESIALLQHHTQIADEVLGRPHHIALNLHSNLALVLGDAGETDRAVEELRHIVRTYRRTGRGGERECHDATYNLALALDRLGQREEAVAEMRRAWEGRRRLLGDGDTFTVSSGWELARMQRAAGEDGAAVETLAWIWGQRPDGWPQGEPMRSQLHDVAARSYAGCLDALGRGAEALSLLRTLRQELLEAGIGGERIEALDRAINTLTGG